MKKLIYSILAVFVALCTLPVSIQAVEPDTITLSEAVELSCNVFPEYEAQIRGINSIQKNYSRNSSNNLLGNAIVCETRITEDGEIFNYQEDARGIVVVTFSYGSTLVDSASGSGYAYHKCNLVVYCNVSDEVFQVKNFEYTNVQGGYDMINSYGSTDSSTATVRYVVGNTRETATMKAFVRYYVTFTANKQGLSSVVNSYLQAEVGDESCIYNVYPE